ncbi:Integrator complex subunit 7 [Xenoophorus captivus]|uniref:Integrator complex subunit 7 n=1 Tax=Xenoophorus captivus TaxID=1517983 RepID=A0ABV0QGB5_9TELE
MSLSTARSFLSEACYGEQELDANSALMELDKGLRSGKLGEQCEAVVLFPKLFQKYPFPILINSAFLKLADIFRLGMLGSLASIIPERKNAHHSIRQSLDSHDNVEVEAAIFAAASFSAQSKYEKLIGRTLLYHLKICDCFLAQMIHFTVLNSQGLCCWNM